MESTNSNKNSVETNVQICLKMMVSLKQLKMDTNNLRCELAQMQTDLMLLYEPPYLDLLKNLEKYGDNNALGANYDKFFQ